MTRFLMTTALAAAMATSAYADAHSTAPEFISEAPETALMTSELLGARVYATETEVNAMAYSEGMETEWDDIGEVNELIVARDGSVQGVILGVGGFLGLGEKDVAVPMDRLQFVSSGDEMNEFLIVINASAETLENAPAFVPEGEQQQAETGASQMMEEGETEMAEGQGTATMLGEETEMAAEGSADTTLMGEGEMEVADTPEMPMGEGETQEAARMETPATDDGTFTGQSEAEVATVEAGEGPLTEGSDGTEMAGTGDENTSMMQDEDVTVATTGGMPMTDAETTEELGAANAPLFAPDYEREGYSRIAGADITAERLQGAVVYDVNDENVGEVGELILDGNEISQVIIDFGGFLGLGEKPIAMSMDALNVQMSNTGDSLRVYVDVTEDQLDQMPAYEG